MINGNRKKNLISRILSFVKPNMKYLVIALISAVLSVASTLLVPVFTGDAIDCVVGAGNVDFSAIIPILIKIIICIIFGALFQWIMYYSTSIITHRTVRLMRSQVFSHLENVPLKYIDSTAHGDIINRVVNDIDQISDGLLQGFQQLFTGVVTILGTLIFMLAINVSITIVVVVITPVSLFVAATISKLCFNKFKEQSIIKSEISAFSEEMINNQKLVKAFSYEKKAEEKFAEINERLKVCGIKAQFYSALVNPSTRFVNGLVYTGVGIFGALSVISNPAFTVGSLSCFLQYANQYTKPFNEISGVVAELQSAFASAQRVFELIDTEAEISDVNAEEIQNCDGSLTINDASFSYNPNVSLIEGLNLDIKSGQRIAIVGPTGCGKTTIINLLMRFYDVDKGEICVSRKPIKSIKRESLRSCFGIVLQETWLFKGTVRENIAYGRPNAAMDEIVEASKAAYCHSFIKRLPNGYDTVITDGSELSQGQKQLLCIARIMLTMPPMLILDEATSNIDTRTEIKIQDAFAKIMKGRTSFIIAHRLSTIKESDTILVMKSGKIIEVGRHEELLEKNGFYAGIYNSQFVG